MKICLIGLNLTNLILAQVFAEKKIKVDIYLNKKIKKTKTKRTIAISSDNFDYLEFLIKSKIVSWKSKEIKIFTEGSKTQDVINFKKKREVFNLVLYSKLNEIFHKKIKKSKYIKLHYFDTSSFIIIKKIKNYDLVINTESRNFISNKFFTNKIKKNYKSCAYTFLINHKHKKNNIALQVFTKFGPLAFLPLSNTQTSIVFSYKGKKINSKKILNLFNKYNSFFSVTKISKIEDFSLSLEMLRNYTHKNILAFGELIHRIHPLAGQGFNMTIRDIKILLEIIQNKIDLGLAINSSVNKEFQKNTKHKNFIFSNGIDFIYEFFNYESKAKNNFLLNSLKYIGSKNSINNMLKKLADTGLNY